MCTYIYIYIHTYCSSQECTSQGNKTTGRSVETSEFLTQRAYALSSYALTCAALIFGTCALPPSPLL